MNPILIPFAGAGGLSQAVGTILEKKVIGRRKIEYKSYTVYHFIGIIAAMVPFIWFFWRISPEAFLAKNLLIFAGIIIASVTGNLLCFYSYEREKISELEPIKLFEPLFVIFLAFIMYASERHTQTGVLIAAFIASLALIFSHIGKHHLSFNRYMLAALGGSFFFALELALAKSILPYYSPISLYFTRCVLVFLAGFAVFRPKPSALDKAAWKNIFLVGAIWAFFRILLYFGYSHYGVIFTTLLFIIAPVFIYIFASIYLREKLTWRNIVATAIIVACIAYVIITTV